MAKNEQAVQAQDFPRAIGNPARNALLHAGYTRMEELNGVSEKKILALHGVGPKAVRILKEEMAVKGLAFAP